VLYVCLLIFNDKNYNDYDYKAVLFVIHRKPLRHNTIFLIALQASVSVCPLALLNQPAIDAALHLKDSQ
jgi:hypothetical protein